MKPVIVFDLNETLLDLSALDPAFARIFGGSATELRGTWFRQVLELFLTATVTDRYRSFDRLTVDALQMLAAQRGRGVSADDIALLKEALGQIPAYGDVQPGLEQLARAGFTIATLTNSTEASALRLLEHAKLRTLFDRALSADAIERYKPSREAYEYAAAELGIEPGAILLVAAHAWDIAGAQAAACGTAFVARAGKALNPALPSPEFTAPDVRLLAEQIVARHS